MACVFHHNVKHLWHYGKVNFIKKSSIYVMQISSNFSNGEAKSHRILMFLCLQKMPHNALTPQCPMTGSRKLCNIGSLVLGYFPLFCGITEGILSKCQAFMACEFHQNIKHLWYVNFIKISSVYGMQISSKFPASVACECHQKVKHLWHVNFIKMSSIYGM